MILIVDFGSQYNQLIARRIKENKVQCEIVPPHKIVISDNVEANKFPLRNLCASTTSETLVEGIILSGGPGSVYDENRPKIDSSIFELGIPVLGICYGMQYMVHVLGGEVKTGAKKEYGLTKVGMNTRSKLFKDIKPTDCWMSHGDYVSKLPPNFITTAMTETTNIAAFEKDNLFGVQFHPEVSHTKCGKQIIKNFIDICSLNSLYSCCDNTDTRDAFTTTTINTIRDTVGTNQVVLGLSGGIDSSVVAALIHRAIGNQLHCIFVDHGLHNEISIEYDRYIHVDAKDRFLKALEGVIDPEEKRKIIGNLFIEIFEERAKEIGDVRFLAQGTLYPDVIESGSPNEASAQTIKGHHNVKGLPEVMNLKLIEPLRSLFKDEVRIIGEELGLSEKLIQKHPFPGPGLAIRIAGEVTEERLEVLRNTDRILLESMRHSGWYDRLWQAFTILLPVKSVGVKGDQRTYEDTIVIRVVTSEDGMTADWAELPYDLIRIISNKITNEVSGVNRVLYDITSKPPGTIEWE